MTDRTLPSNSNSDECCPECGAPSASPPAEVYCVECATKGWDEDAAAWSQDRGKCEFCGLFMRRDGKGHEACLQEYDRSTTAA